MKTVYIDSQNVHKAIEKINRKLDRYKFFHYMHNKYKVDNIVMFLGYIDSFQPFYDKLKKIGYKLVFKKTALIHNKIVKGNVDIDIAMRVLIDFFEKKLSTGYLVTADGDYNSLVDFMRENNILGKVIIPGMHDTSKFLTQSAGKQVHNIGNLQSILGA